MRKTHFRLGSLTVGALLLFGSALPLAAQRSAHPRSSPSPSSHAPSGVSSGSRHAVPRGGSSAPSPSSPAGPHRPTGATRRGPSGHSYYPRSYGRYYGGLGFGYGLGYWGGYYGYPYYNGFYGPYFSPWGYPYSAVVVRDWNGGYDGYPGYEVRAYGAIDVNVKPKAAEVYVDGRLVGTADAYDGFPRYLWLEAGPHELTLVLDGYQNFARSVEVLPDQVMSIKAKMSPGTAARPQAAAPAAPVAPARNEPASLSLHVGPADASVYLDGRFIGTGAEIGGAPRPLLLDPGHHTLQVVHPDYRSERRELDLVGGDTTSIDIDLIASQR